MFGLPVHLHGRQRSAQTHEAWPDWPGDHDPGPAAVGLGSASVKSILTGVIIQKDIKVKFVPVRKIWRFSDVHGPNVVFLCMCTFDSRPLGSRDIETP